MTKGHTRHALPLLAVVGSFALGVFVDGWLRTYGPPKPVQAVAEPRDVPVEPAHAPASPPVVVEPTIAPAPAATIGVAATAGPLRLPIDGVTVESLKGGFFERRAGDTRPHEAVDILAPRGTTIHAVQDGTIAKLFFSKAGGITIYQFDPVGRLCYYYAHLERYADGLHEGQHVSQGDVLGYVGTSGNAPPDTPHLHFAVFELNADHKWWQGTPLDPYVVFKTKG